MSLTLEQLQNRTIGRGLVKPLRRMASSDFIATTGSALIRSSIQQILGTAPGEIRWRPRFGVDLERFRNRNISERNLNDLTVAIQESLKRYEPRINASGVTAEVQNGVIRVRIVWTIATGRATPNNAVIAGPFTTEVEV
jgi:phage baseplate assembly protein W